jgi:hypothetical protein
MWRLYQLITVAESKKSANELQKVREEAVKTAALVQYKHLLMIERDNLIHEKETYYKKLVEGDEKLNNLQAANLSLQASMDAQVETLKQMEADKAKLQADFETANQARQQVGIEPQAEDQEIEGMDPEALRTELKQTRFVLAKITSRNETFLRPRRQDLKADHQIIQPSHACRTGYSLHKDQQATL